MNAPAETVVVVHGLWMNGAEAGFAVNALWPVGCVSVTHAPTRRGLLTNCSAPAPLAHSPPLLMGDSKSP